MVVSCWQAGRQGGEGEGGKGSQILNQYFSLYAKQSLPGPGKLASGIAGRHHQHSWFASHISLSLSLSLSSLYTQHLSRLGFDFKVTLQIFYHYF